MENWEQWEEKYKPIPNHIDKEGTYYADQNGINYSFETYGKELEHIQNQDPKYSPSTNQGSHSSFTPSSSIRTVAEYSFVIFIGYLLILFL